MHAALLQNQYLITVAEIKKALQLRGLSVDGLKAELQQRLKDAIDNNAATTHTTNTAMEATININDTTGNAEHAEFATEPPTHAKKTTTMTVEDVDKMKGKSLISRITCVHYFTKGNHRRTHVLSLSPSHIAPQFQ
jgi:fido (protein-threonine AMPylation protein)